MSDQTSQSASAVAADEPSQGLRIYKGGQGYYTRMGSVIGVALVGLLGLVWLWDELVKVRIGELNSLYFAAGVSVLILAVLTFITYYLVFVKPKTVDFLIATEGEMKKVNWSTRREVIGSTVAVIFTAVILAVFCWGLEIFFVWFFQLIRVLERGEA